MGAYRNAIICVAAAATMALAAADAAVAQKIFSRGGSPNVGVGRGGDGNGGYRGGGYRGGGWGVAIPGVLMAIPQYGPRGVYIEDDAVPQGPRRSTRRDASGAPSANERRLVPDEVVIEVANSVSPQQIDALATPLSAHPYRIPDSPAVRHNFIPLAHSRPPLSRLGSARVGS